MSAQIFDRGYRRYDGPRTGVRGAIRTLVINALQRSLGLRRPARFKIVPIIVIGLAFVPAIVFVGISALIPREISQDLVVPFSGYFSTTTTSLFLLASFSGSEMLCTDRRSGMLGVYLASPLTRPVYLLSKAAAATALMLLVSLLPNLLYFFSLVLQGNGPDGFGTAVKVLVQIVLAAAMIAVYYAAVSLAVSSMTERSAVAITTTLGLLVGSGVMSGILVESLEAPPAFRLFDLFSLPIELAPRIFGESGDWSTYDNPTWTLLVAWVAIVGGAAGIIWARYRHLAVQR